MFWDLGDVYASRMPFSIEVALRKIAMLDVILHIYSGKQIQSYVF